MGKSPGKWIKKVLLGKKSKNGSAEKKAPYEVISVNPHLPGDMPRQLTPPSGESIELERDSSVNLSSDGTFLTQKQDEVVESTAVLSSTNSGVVVLQEKAAIKAQAAFRGYLARRAFRALKGIIRLQALIRGHLVRRQAVATLHCMHAIVRFQAVVRGQRVRLSDVGSQVLKKCRSVDSKRLDLAPISTHPRSEKLSSNVFVIKLVSSLPSAKPLSLDYDVAEPNSAWSWLQRWSKSKFWEPLPPPKKTLTSKHQRRNSNIPIVERDSGKSKRIVHVSSDSEKSKRVHRKPLTHQIESTQEHPQSELERVKRSLRKVTEEGSASVKPETVVEKLPKFSKKSSPVAEVSEPVVAAVEEPMVEPAEKALFEEPIVEMISSNTSSDEKAVSNVKATEEMSLKDQEPMVNEELSSKETQNIQRRKSLSGKQEYYPENNNNNSEKSPKVPSYMAATASAKAKLRAQGSPNLAQEVAEAAFVRRHSLPSLANGKSSSQSPRIQKLTVHANGKGGSRSDRSLLSSRDGNEKVIQPGWRR